MPKGRFDIIIIGGGVNGAAIARDAAGRGLEVLLVEQGDLAGQTSSKSTKLFHGGLRYLEYFDFKLVRDALIEREILLKNMPHISWGMRFVMPYAPDLRFDAETPASKMMARAMPWLKGRRPKWMIRAGLFFYDHVGKREILAGTARIDLADAPEGVPLKSKYQQAYEYSDCWVDDARLVVLLARDAQNHGAKILTRNRAISAKRHADYWQLKTEEGTYEARALVNASGPWVERFMREAVQLMPKARVRLVKGSHIIVPKIFDHEKCYILQGTDGRIVFAIPYEEEFTLIGTTDSVEDNLNNAPQCTDEDKRYLCTFASDYFDKPVRPEDVVWSYAGIRPLYDDGASSASAATREYVLTLNDDAAPILNVFGGKITTHRKLAEDALTKLSQYFEMGEHWTKEAPLPGGDFAVDGFDALCAKLQSDYPFMDAKHLRRLARCYGTCVHAVLGEAKSLQDLGQGFAAGLTEREIRYLVEEEFARTAEDILWRRTKLGLHMSEGEIGEVEGFLENLIEQNQQQQTG